MAKPYIPYDGPVVTRADSLSKGLARFYTGKPCKHGHLSERTTSNGGCIWCNTLTGYALYQADPAKAYRKSLVWKAANKETVRAGARIYAKAHREQANAWKAANRDKVNNAERESRKRNPDRYKAAAARYIASDLGASSRASYYEANKDVILQRVMEWKAANHDRTIEARSAHYAANKDAIKQRVRDWNEANPEGPRTRSRNYRARKYQAEGSHTRAEVEELLIKQDGRCVYCNVDITAAYHGDHIVALVRGGSNWISNIQLTCGPCNNAKRAMEHEEFVRRLKLKAA